MPVKTKAKAQRTIQVRNIETLKTIEALQEKLDIKTATGVIDQAVKFHLPKTETVDRLEVKVYELENELAKIKGVLRRKKQADQEFEDLCNSVFR